MFSSLILFPSLHYFHGVVVERYLEIREGATGTVVTVIEILSPKNKRTGEGRIAYERKRN